MTPMQRLKNQLNFLKNLSFVEVLELNGKEHKNTFVRSKLYSSKAVMFDYLILFNMKFNGVYRNKKNDLRYNQSFGFAINYKNCESTIRASLKLNKDTSAEYSKEYSIEEIKPLLDILIGSLNDKNVLTLFKDTFKIVISSELSEKKVSLIKKEYDKIFNDLKNKIMNLNQARKTISENLIKNEDYNCPIRKEMCSKLKKLVREIQEMHESKNSIFISKSKDMPAIVRRHFSKAIEDGKL